MRRQLVAIAAAITTAAAVGLALPAIAQSEPELFEGNVTCDELELEGLTDAFEELTGDEDNDFFTATVSEDGKFLDVVAKEGFVILAVIVKGGPDSNVYFEEPFTDMHAPELEKSGNIPEISHYEVCIGEEEEETSPPPTSPPPTTDTTPPTTDTPTMQPTTPAAVPTEVPAGANDGTSGSPALLGMVLAGSAALGGAAVVARRRFLHDS